jgi:hypothetical protein
VGGASWGGYGAPVRLFLRLCTTSLWSGRDRAGVWNCTYHSLPAFCCSRCRATHLDAFKVDGEERDGQSSKVSKQPDASASKMYRKPGHTEAYRPKQPCAFGTQVLPSRPPLHSTSALYEASHAGRWVMPRPGRRPVSQAGSVRWDGRASLQTSRRGP